MPNSSLASAQRQGPKNRKSMKRWQSSRRREERLLTILSTTNSALSESLLFFVYSHSNAAEREKIGQRVVDVDERARAINEHDFLLNRSYYDAYLIIQFGDLEHVIRRGGEFLGGKLSIEVHQRDLASFAAEENLRMKMYDLLVPCWTLAAYRRKTSFR
jgi:hypothetical protein